MERLFHFERLSRSSPLARPETLERPCNGFDSDAEPNAQIIIMYFASSLTEMRIFYPNLNKFRLMKSSASEPQIGKRNHMYHILRTTGPFTCFVSAYLVHDKLNEKASKLEVSNA